MSGSQAEPETDPALGLLDPEEPHAYNQWVSARQGKSELLEGPCGPWEW